MPFNLPGPGLPEGISLFEIFREATLASAAGRDYLRSDDGKQVLFSNAGPDSVPSQPSPWLINFDNETNAYRFGLSGSKSDASTEAGGTLGIIYDTIPTILPANSTNSVIYWQIKEVDSPFQINGQEAVKFNLMPLINYADQVPRCLTYILPGTPPGNISAPLIMPCNSTLAADQLLVILPFNSGTAT